MKTYKIPELRIEIQAEDDADFERKKKKLMERGKRKTTGGKVQGIINDFKF